MQQTQLKWISQWYQQASDYVMVFSKEWNLLWQNRACPILQDITDYQKFFGFSNHKKAKRGNYIICHAGELYRVQLDQNDIDEPLFLIRMETTPCTEATLENELWCNEIENRLASVRNQIFGISNAVTALYYAVEELSDDCPRPLLEDQMQQLNVIKGNCCRLMRPTILLLEQMRYCQKKDISGSPFFLDHELSNFVESCRKILGRTVRLQQECASQLCICVNRERFLICLLCIILQMEHQHPDITQIHLQAELQGTQIALTFTADSNGMDETAPRHSILKPLYQTPLLSQEETIIRYFCRCYHATLLHTGYGDRAVYVLRIPPCDSQTPLSLQSTKQRMKDDSASLYEIMLADISNYRFY